MILPTALHAGSTNEIASIIEGRGSRIEDRALEGRRGDMIMGNDDFGGSGGEP